MKVVLQALNSLTEDKLITLQMFSKTLLDLSQLLKETGIQTPTKPGAFYGRGFADLGVEVFTLLPNNKLLSIFTGSSNTTWLDNEKFLFWIPSIEECQEEISKLGFAVTSCDNIDSRKWEVSATDNKNILTSSNTDLWPAFINLTLLCIKQKKN